MKQTTKILTIATIIFLAITATTHAQTKTQPFRLGVGLNVGAATTDGFNVTLGGDLKLQKDFTDVISGSLATGYTNFFANKNKSYTESYGFVPLKAGIKFFPTKGVYLGAEAGAAFGTKEGAGTSFLYAPAVGITFNTNYDFSARYEALNQNSGTIGHVALRLAYAFSL